MNNRLINYLFVFITLLFVACSYAPTSESETTQWRGPNRDGIYPDKDLLKEWPVEGPELIWKFDQLGLGYGGPVISDQKIYINGTIDSVSYLFALDMNGEMLWKKAYGKEWMTSFPGVRSTVNIVDEYSYLLSGKGELICLQTSNGEIIWKQDLVTEYEAQKTMYGYSEHLIVNGDVLYCTPGGKEHNVIAVNRFTGDLIWTSKAKGEASAYCNPILAKIAGIEYFITMTDKSVLSINAENGKLAWTFPLEGIKNGAHANTPYFRDGYLFLMDGFEIGCLMLKVAEDGMSAEQVWKNELMDETQGHSVVIGDRIYGSAESKKKTICLDWNTGEVLFELKKYAPGTLISADNYLYAYTYNGLLGIMEIGENEFIDRGSVKLEKKRQIHISHPVIHKGVLYIRYANELMAFDIQKKS